MAARDRGDNMSANQILETMRYLGWVTHDENGVVTDEAYHVSRQLVGRVVENVMLSSVIATAVDEFRTEQKYRELDKQSKLGLNEVTVAALAKLNNKSS